ncbi:MAG: Response regulator receiver modulated diguanylate cyclase/phosphodiesterase [Bryobacterales bacterium]|jgi:two-component system, chemotaxis family, response regulator Rcp1|nr:Response regulator receiver modulated diguanylate cyclase/phosphodiesterase [Bryobacterales bacterium]
MVSEERVKRGETIQQGNVLDRDNPAKSGRMYKREPRKVAEILVIEDNPGDVRLLEEVFRELQADIHITVARDGAEGLEMVHGSTSGKRLLPDLILLDLNLPKVSGHDVLSRLKSNPLTSRIPVIVLTSSKAEIDVRRAYELHVNAYLKKPSTLEGLLSAAEDITNFWLRTATLPS